MDHMLHSSLTRVLFWPRLTCSCFFLLGELCSPVVVEGGTFVGSALGWLGRESSIHMPYNTAKMGRRYTHTEQRTYEGKEKVERGGKGEEGVERPEKRIRLDGEDVSDVSSYTLPLPHLPASPHTLLSTSPPPLSISPSPPSSPDTDVVLALDAHTRTTGQLPPTDTTNTHNPSPAHTFTNPSTSTSLHSTSLPLT